MTKLYGNTWSPLCLSIILIAFVGQVSAADNISSNGDPSSDTILTLGFMILFFSSTNTLGANISQLPNAMHNVGSTDILNRVRGLEGSSSSSIIGTPSVTDGSFLILVLCLSPNLSCLHSPYSFEVVF